jgi:two-component system, NtrC family, sensor kinase
MASEVLASLSQIKELLWPGAAEQDDAFLLEIQRLSRRGVRLMAFIFLCLVAIVYPVIYILSVYPITHRDAFGALLVGFVAALVLLAFSRSRWALRHSRLFSLVVIVLSTLGSYYMDLRFGVDVNQAERFVLSDVTGALLVAVVVVPALPWQMFTVGMLMAAFYPVFYAFSRWPAEVPDHDLVPLTTVIILDAVLCAILSAINYNRLYSLYRSHNTVLGVQRELLLSEGAASIGRLSAALSHELNSPLGSMKSSNATLKDLRARSAGASAEQRQQLDDVADELQQATDTALERMENIVHRMQRFTNLDRAEERDFSPNQVIEDVVSLLGPERTEKVQIRLLLSDVPRIRSRPQQVSAVLSSLLQDSVELSPSGECVEIRSDHIESNLEITINDRRERISSQELNTLFDPRFEVRGSRIGTGNWTWFNARQIVRELGGDLFVSSNAERTATRITLPVSSR